MALALSIIFHRSQLTLHFDPEGSAIRLGLLSPILCVLFINISLGDPLGEVEDIFLSRMRMLRSVHMSSVLALLALSFAAFLFIDGPGSQLGQMVRNSAWLTGLLLLTAALVSSYQAWILPIGVVLATYGFGMDYSVGVPRDWAVLLHELTTTNLLTGIAVVSAGIASFIWWGPRTHSNNEMAF